VVARGPGRPEAVRPGRPGARGAGGGQVGHVLISLGRNGGGATLEAGGEGEGEGEGVVEVGWAAPSRHLEVWVRDDGPGVGDPANLFVPFYTTKPEGSGIGLALSRQIAGARGGTRAPAHPRGAAG